MRHLRQIITAGMLGLLLAACESRGTKAPAVLPTTTVPIRQAETISPTFLPTLTAAPAETDSTLNLWIDPNLPHAFRDGLEVRKNVHLVQESGQADVRLSFASGPTKAGQVRMRWTFVLAARFPTLDDNVNSVNLKQLWNGGDPGGHDLLLSADTRQVFASLWGLPNSETVHVLDPKDLLDAAWKDPKAEALLPFEDIEARWKVLKVDGLDPLDRTMNEQIYPLSIVVQVSGPNNDNLQKVYSQVTFPPSNREASRLVTLAMTGTTALVRKTAEMMNTKGVAFPARDIGDLLRSADLTHISNEVSFNQDCTPARSASPEGIFCSAPAYIQLLDDVGTDIVELTGNHNLDKGETAFRFSYNLFKERKWGTYGGGLDLEDARKALLIQRGETQLAFLGCNMAGPSQAWAGINHPGAATCDINALDQQVRELRSKGILPIVTFQAFETEDYMPAPMQRPSDYRRIAQAGAVIVSGSQAHFPQGFGFEPGSLIHYGLGNLFFDQVEPEAIRRSFIDWHIFYGDKYLGAELVTIMLEDYGKPRLMTADERRSFLTDVFKAGGW